MGGLPIIVLGMHRSGTSCIAGMIAAAGVATAGDAALRNWDNARGHHEMREAIRLNESVLAHSGGHWLAPPPAVRWTADHAAARDRLLATTIDGRPVLVKDPRSLLVLAFWRAARVPFHAIGVVRHPVAVARSLAAWREMPADDAVALWLAHNRALADDRAHHATPIVDFEASPAGVTGAVCAACAGLGAELDAVAVASAYTPHLVHHDGDGDGAAAPADPNLDAAVALYRALTDGGTAAARPGFPRADLAAFSARLAAGDVDAAVAHARDALARTVDAAAVLVPVTTALARRRELARALALIEAHADRVDAEVAALLLGKLQLAAGAADAAVDHLARACATARPLFQARHLLAVALRAAGRTAVARAAMAEVAADALYPHVLLATLAEWSWTDGDPAAALVELAAAIAAAPPHRRGRLRTRRAEWLVAGGAVELARAELTLAREEDPGYARSAAVLARLPKP